MKQKIIHHRGTCLPQAGEGAKRLKQSQNTKHGKELTPFHTLEI